MMADWIYTTISTNFGNFTENDSKGIFNSINIDPEIKRIRQEMTGTNFWKLESKRMSSNWVNRYANVKYAGSGKNGKANQSAL